MFPPEMDAHFFPSPKKQMILRFKEFGFCRKAPHLFWVGTKKCVIPLVEKVMTSMLNINFPTKNRRVDSRSLTAMQLS